MCQEKLKDTENENLDHDLGKKLRVCEFKNDCIINTYIIIIISMCTNCTIIYIIYNIIYYNYIYIYIYI